MTASSTTRPKDPPAFVPGRTYWRDGELMVEVRPGHFVNEKAARALGVLPQTEGTEG
jgi:hypothetical protein